WHMQLLGTDPHARMSAESPLAGKVNYLLGKDPAQWRTGLATYGKVRYRGVYPGIDLVYYGNQRQLEYDFVVAPGVNPAAIRFALTDARRLRVDQHGDLVADLPGGHIVWRHPVAYQEIAGKRLPVTAR